MKDAVLCGFLERQNALLKDFCNASSRLECEAIQQDPDLPANLFMIKMKAKHLLMENGVVKASSRSCLIAIRYPEDFLRRAESHAGEIINIVAPTNLWHPNVAIPYICTGRIIAGTSLEDFILRCYEIITYNNFTPREDDAMNPAACAWARQHMAEFPLETAPLRDLNPSTTQSGNRADFVLELDTGERV